MNWRAILAVLCLLLVFPAQAQNSSLNVPATLVAESITPKPAEEVTLAFSIKPKAGWHGYWENPGDAGFGMQLEWTLPSGVTAGALRYPVPEPLLISGLMNHVFEHDHAVLVPLKLDAGIAPGTKLPISVKAQWLACTDKVCVPQNDTLSIDLVAGGGTRTAQAAKQFDAWRAALPVPLDRQARYEINGKRIEIAIPFPANAGADKPYFFPRNTEVFRYAAPQTARRTGDWLVIGGEVTRKYEGVVSGVLRFGKGQGLEITAKRREVPKGGVEVPVSGQLAAPPPLDPAGIMLTLVAAILGGMLLNLMPCVFPILGLKALALAKIGNEEAAAKRDALAYSAGIILSCLLLGALMLILRSWGEQVGWAFQLQEPRVVIALLLLMVAVTANLAGLFEVPSISVGGGLARGDSPAASFWTGVLAAIVATPCTGPFMAAALGAALLLPPLLALLLFAGLGFGLALPFLAIAFVPALRRMMPKSGDWLNRFRKWMAVPMALTALGLLWLLSRLGGHIGLWLGVAASIVVIALLYWLGRRQRGGLGGAVAIMVAVLALAAAAVIALPREAVLTTAEVDILKSEPFSESRLAKLRADGKPVFVYFTADWCVTCKVNETAAINRADTAAAFKKAGIVTLKGDFTRSDPAITRFLGEHGRSGVPFYLFYPAGGGEPKELAQILTPALLADLAKP